MTIWSFIEIFFDHPTSGKHGLAIRPYISYSDRSTLFSHRRDGLEIGEISDIYRMAMESVNISYRLINYMVDFFMVSLIYGFLDLITLGYLPDLLIFLVFFFYYYYMESRTGQTFGKRITNTVVVDMHCGKPSTRAILIRSLCRILWVDALSFLLGRYGMHDGYSKTKVVKVAE